MGQLARPLALLCSAAVTSALSLAAAPALAQSSVSGITVIAPPVNKYESEFSYKVSYADLDLRKPEARKEFDRRVSVTAEYVCKTLKETDVSACTRTAISRAAPAVSRAKQIGMTKVIKFTPGEPWIPPPGAQ